MRTCLLLLFILLSYWLITLVKFSIPICFFLKTQNAWQGDCDLWRRDRTDTSGQQFVAGCHVSVVDASSSFFFFFFFFLAIRADSLIFFICACVGVCFPSGGMSLHSAGLTAVSSLTADDVGASGHMFWTLTLFEFYEL
jgi:hypothetical protein